MKRFSCDGGQRVFFENLSCTHCGHFLGFDPASLGLVTLGAVVDNQYADATGARFRLCRNYVDHQICNWLISAEREDAYCVSCWRTIMVPNLTNERNVTLWGRLEQAKRRLLYTLLKLGLPLDGIDGGPPMRFRFLEDRRANPEADEAIVLTGHDYGTITVNVAEADGSIRHAVREEMREHYRTILGHFRHESGH